MPVPYPRKIFILSLLLLCAVTLLRAQDRCGTDQYMKMLGADSRQKQLFEEWLKGKLAVEAKGTKQSKRSGTYRIPVVVHIIHSGVNHPTNISDEQIQSQIRVLNEDFRRMNADAANTPAEFASVAGSIDIEFVLAKQTPEGLPTNGIVRVAGRKIAWSIGDSYELKATSYWPAENYLNIWVCNVTDFLGYAQFPVTNLLSGLESASTNRLTDGVIVKYSVFGSVDDGNFNLESGFDKGRTATHEIGHYLGLRHIWGDDDNDCGGNGDYVSDTPDQSGPTSFCPSHPRVTCTLNSMFQNYLDYTNDECMNLFTAGQVNRMVTVLENSPRRKSLLTSPGLSDPIPVSNDLGIKSIITPSDGNCPGPVSPMVEIRNYGTETATSGKVTLKRNGTFVETKSFTFILAPLESATLTFSPLTMVPGTGTVSFEITEVNGSTDENSLNNTATRSVLVPEIIPTPVVESLETLPSKWIILNPDQSLTWQLATAPASAAANKAMKMNFYDYVDSEGEIDMFVTPQLDLSDVPMAQLLFDVSHARFESSNDGLRVIVLRDCNTDINLGEVIYEKAGAALATHSSTTNPFVPDGQADWRTESVNLEALIGESGIQLAFVGVNDYGNNLFLDNIRILTEGFANLTLKEIISPAQVTCDTDLQPKLRIRNSGTGVSSFEVEYTINGSTSTHTVNPGVLAAGEEKEFNLPGIVLNEGVNAVSFRVLNPNGTQDLDPSDNSRSSEVVVKFVETPSPFRETFEPPFLDEWTIMKPQGNSTWEPINLDDRAVVYKGFTNTTIGDEGWLVSPVFDLTNASQSRLFFDISYSLPTGPSETLEVRVAKGCDNPFETIASFSGELLTTRKQSGEWEPETEDHWTKKSISLTSLAGLSDVRLAFVVHNRNGNNLYLDNIELFLSDDLSPVEVDGVFNIYPNPARSGNIISVTFNLPELEDVVLEISDSMGRVIARDTYSGILNQTLPFDFEGRNSGVYLVRAIVAGKVYVSKFLYSH